MAQSGINPTGVSPRQHDEMVWSAISYDWAVAVFDTSRVLTFIVSLALIVYGSFRAIHIESRLNDDEEPSSDKNNNDGYKSYFLGDIFTIESSQALVLPLCASCTLLCMFFFFNSLQLFFLLLTSVLSVITFSFLLLPVCQYITSPCFNKTSKVPLCCFGRFTSAEICSLLLSLIVVVLWVLTGHWLLMDALGMAFCVTMIAFVRLPSLKVSVILLLGLLMYDIFWVFLSEYLFNVNVMVKVATRPAYNPVNYLTKKLHVQNMLHVPHRLSLPAKLVFPSSQRSGRYSMLGLGDIVMPGIFLCFVLRFENHQKQSASYQPTSRLTYFHCSLIGYFVGLLTATIASELTSAAQPALLYLVPFTVLPLVIKAYMQGDLRRMWTNPFVQTTVKKNLEV